MLEESNNIWKDNTSGALHWLKVPHFLSHLLAWFLRDLVAHLDFKIGWKKLGKIMFCYFEHSRMWPVHVLACQLDIGDNASPASQIYGRSEFSNLPGQLMAVPEKTNAGWVKSRYI